MIAESIDQAVRMLRDINARKVLLQVPDGLKPRVFEFFEKFSGEFNVVISGEPFYGACDTGNFTLRSGIDCIVQFGHSTIPNIAYPVPVIFVEWRNENIPEFSSVSTEILLRRKYRKVGLLASIQYTDMLDALRNVLVERGHEVFIGKVDGRMAHPGQVLGCNFSAAHSVSSEVDCYILLSTGKFHAIGVQLSTDIETFILDLNSLSLESMKDETDMFLRKRYVRISKALDARKICVAVNTKVGQRRDELAAVIHKQVRELGLESVIVLTDDVKPSDFENMRCDAVVFTGCPRVSIDDHDKFSMPVLTPPEFQQLFGLKKSRKYVMDEIVSVSSNSPSV